MIEGYIQIGDKYYKYEDIQSVLKSRIIGYTEEELIPSEE